MHKICLVENCNEEVNAKGYCKIHYMQNWRKRNPEKEKMIAKRTYQKNKTKILIKRKKYQEENREKILKNQREYYLTKLKKTF